MYLGADTNLQTLLYPHNNPSCVAVGSSCVRKEAGYVGLCLEWTRVSQCHAPYLSPSIGRRADARVFRRAANMTSVANPTHERKPAPGVWSNPNRELDDQDSDSDTVLLPTTQKERNDIAKRMSVLFKVKIQNSTDDTIPLFPLEAQVRKNNPEAAREGKKLSVRSDQKYAVTTEAPNVLDRGIRHRSRRRRRYNHRPTRLKKDSATSAPDSVSHVSKTQRENIKLSARETHRRNDTERSKSEVKPTRDSKTERNGKANKTNTVACKAVDHFQLDSQRSCLYQVGSMVDILDEYKSQRTGKVWKQWRKAKIVDSLCDDIYVHFDGYDKKYNAWINTVLEKERIAELGVHTGLKSTAKSEILWPFEEFEVGQEVMVKDIFRSLRTTRVSHKWRKAHITDLDYDPDLFIIKRYRIHFTGWNANRDIWIGTGEYDSRIMSMTRYKDTNEDTMSLRSVDQTAAEEKRKRREKREQGVSTLMKSKRTPRATEQSGSSMNEEDLLLPWHDPEEEFLHMLENNEDECSTESVQQFRTATARDATAYSSWRNFKVGKFYDVADHENHWYEAEVVELWSSPTHSDEIEKVKMHILFSDDKEEDQWYERNSSRIEPHMSRIYLPGVELVNGHRIDVLNQTSYETSKWLSAIVIETNRSTVKVHFDGYSQFFDERIDRTSQRIMPYGHKSKTSSKDFQKVVDFHYNSSNITPLSLANTPIVSSRSPIQHPSRLSLDQPVAVSLVDEGRNNGRSEDDRVGGLVDDLLSILEEIKLQITTARGETISVLFEKLELVDLQALEYNLGAEWKEKIATVTSEMRATLASRQGEEREATFPTPSAPRLDVCSYEENNCNSVADEPCSEPTLFVQLSETDSRWVADNAYTCCMECEVEFGIFDRRHHCRYCGRLLCNQCSQDLIDSARSCRACFIKKYPYRPRNYSAIQVLQQPGHTTNSDDSIALCNDGSSGLPMPLVTPTASMPLVVCAVVAEGDMRVQDMPLAEAIPVDAGSIGGEASVSFSFSPSYEEL